MTPTTKEVVTGLEQGLAAAKNTWRCNTLMIPLSVIEDILAALRRTEKLERVAEAARKYRASQRRDTLVDMQVCHIVDPALGVHADAALSALDQEQ